MQRNNAFLSLHWIVITSKTFHKQLWPLSRPEKRFLCSAGWIMRATDSDSYTLHKNECWYVLNNYATDFHWIEPHAISCKKYVPLERSFLLVLSWTIVNWRTVMKPCHVQSWQQWCCNLGWKGRDRAQSFVLTFTLQLNILTGTFLLVSSSQHISKSIVVCARSRPKMLTKTCNKEVCQAS